jgi:hypothetical protein
VLADILHNIPKQYKLITAPNKIILRWIICIVKYL